MHIARGRRTLVGTGAALAAVGSGLVLAGAPARADASDIVISELHYHAGSDLDADDWLELTNAGGTPVDLTGWTVAAGVTATLPATSLAAGGRLVVAKDAAQFAATNGFPPDAVYGGNLSNGGEEVQVLDATGAVVDTVTYEDGSAAGSAWPTAPDGGGPSLELRVLGGDNTAAASWGASTVAGGTPGARNSLDGVLPPPDVTGLQATPQRPDPGQAVVVSAGLQPGSTATLTYRVMFGADQAVPMLDDAASPGGAGDGVYAATVPGQAAGTLVRYRVDATSATGVAYSAPAADDSVRHRGYVVRDPAVTSRLPVVEWFMADPVYDDLLANHRYDDVQGEAVWAFEGEVLDGVLMNIRGENSRGARKVQWKVELPRGYSFDLGGRLDYPLDEFALQNYALPRADIGWATVRESGARGLDIEPVRTQRNGRFWSLGRVMETMDGAWRDDKGVDDWAIYKANGGALSRTESPQALAASGRLDKKTREDEDFTDVWTLSERVAPAASPAQLTWIHDNVNIPAMVNYMAVNAVIRHHDSGNRNWWVARDTEGTGRWEMWHWDLNWIFTTAQSDGKGPFLTPDTENRFTIAMLRYPAIREMYFRRLRTLTDRFLAPGRYEAEWDAIAALTTPEWNLDRQLWGGTGPATGRRDFLAGLADRRTTVAGNTGPGLPVPASQSPSASVVVSELQYQPAGGGGEFIELTNPGTTAVDISGWTVDAVGLTVQPGTVVPAGGRVLLVGDDVAFRARFGGGDRFVGGQFPGSLDDAGETVTLRDGSRVVDTVAYAPTDPWPTAAAGTGPSLELGDLAADNALPSSWSATSTTGGTPGRVNTGGSQPPPASEVVLPLRSSWRYDDGRRSLGTAWRSTTYDDRAWKQGVGQLGFGDGDEGTVLGRGPDGGRLMTAYFRSTFEVTTTAGLRDATLELLRDDGAVVYLNGTELVRSNMPTGTVSYSTRASTDVTGSAESRPVSYRIPVTRLRQGTNTLAVEVHQRSSTSSDLSFDAQVTLAR